MSIKVTGCDFELVSNDGENPHIRKENADSKAQLMCAIQKMQLNCLREFGEENIQDNKVLWDLYTQLNRSTQTERALNINQIQASLSSDQCIVVVLAGEQRYRGILIKQHRLQQYDIGSIAFLDAMTKQVLRCAADQNASTRREINNLSARFFPDEIVNYLTKEVIIAPIGLLNNIPYSMLLAKSAIPASTQLSVILSEKTLAGQTFAVANSQTLSATLLQNSKRKIMRSLWAVEPEICLIFMQHFYHALGHAKSAQAALQIARQEMQANKQYDHPYYWAGFVLLAQA